MADPEREIAEGVRLARRAVAIGLDNPVALLTGGQGLRSRGASSGWLRVYQGDHADAIGRWERARCLSPLDLQAATFYSGIGWAHVFAGRYDEAAS